MRHAIPPSAEALYIQRRAARSFWFSLERPTAVCFGGYIVNLLAAAIPDTLDAGMAFYGTPAAKELRKNIKGPLMIQLAELDQRVNESWEEFERDLKAAGANYVMHMYPQANHGFHNDSTGRYDKEKAELAWQRTLEFFQKHLACELPEWRLGQPRGRLRRIIENSKGGRWDLACESHLKSMQGGLLFLGRATLTDIPFASAVCCAAGTNLMAPAHASAGCKTPRPMIPVT